MKWRIFLAKVLELEHLIISGHKGLAHIVIRKDFLRIGRPFLERER